MKKKIILVSIIILTILLISSSIPSKHTDYSLEELKISLKLTNKMIICPYNLKERFKVCSKKNMIKIIDDKHIIEEITSLISSSETMNGSINASGPGIVIHALDKNDNLILNIFVYPHVGLEKDSSFYILNNKYQNKLQKLLNNYK